MLHTSTIATLLALGAPDAAEPEPAEGQAGGAVLLDATGPSGAVSASATPAEPEERWILRNRPKPHDLEVGIFGGVLLPSRRIELQDPDIPQGDYSVVAPDLGLRLAYYPMRFFGMEGEVAFVPARFEDNGAFVYSARAQGVLQLGLWSVTPFVLLGGGVLGVASSQNSAGDDRDPALHVGGGLKIFATKHLLIRADVRDIMSPPENDTNSPAHTIEALLTIGFRFNGKPKPAPPPPKPDRDSDGIADDVDHCPFLAGEDPNGCPFPDSDCDEFRDNVDKCPQQAGVAPEGCPPPDGDGDGILDPDDQCPAEAGPAPTGCPIRDTDGDGLDDPQDKCVSEPETRNGFQDADGCPDEIPQEVSKFTGVIQGIFFDTNKATIKPVSEPVLDAAAKVLQDYPDVKMEIVGHTDDRGTRERNLELSRERADAVKGYIVGKGVPAERIQTRGAGPDEPLDPSKTKAGRAKNRRIEFKILQ